MELRPYQKLAIDQLDQLMFMGVRAPLIVAPTGSGKTVIAAEIIRRAEGSRTLFLAPRRELIHQTCKKLDAFGVKYGVILAGDPRVNLYANVQVASVDTLISRAVRRNKLQLAPFDRLIIDEAHVGLTDTRQRLLDLWPNATIIGLTATPCRSDGKAMGRVYDELIEVSTVADLTDMGFLVPGRYFSVSDPDLRAVRTVGGDFNRKDLDAVMNKPKLVGDIVEHWLEHAPTRRTVVFATSIEHSASLAKEFIEHGVSAEHVDANTPQSARETTFDNFSSGRTQVLTNCTLASIGFDLPELDCVVFARPTKSLGLYIQMLGRGLRPAAGKSDCLVLDHAGNVVRHGLATDDRFWSLHGKYAQDEKKLAEAKRVKEEKGTTETRCPECGCVFGGSNQCPECGYHFPPKAKRIATHDGRLVEVTGLPAGMSDDQRRSFYLQLAGLSEIRGYSKGWAAYKYKEKFGGWPPWSWKEHVDAHGGIDPSMDVIRWAKSRQIAWARGRAKAALMGTQRSLSAVS